MTPTHFNSAISEDETNPWRWIATAIVGQPSEVVVRDSFGVIEVHDPVFLHDNGVWYLIKSKRELSLKPVAWRYAMERTRR